MIDSQKIDLEALSKLSKILFDNNDGTTVRET